MNIFRKIPEHIKKHQRKYLLRKSPDGVTPRMMNCNKLRFGIAPASFSLLDKTPPAYDQGSLGYCFAESLLGSYETSYLKQSGHFLGGSPLFIGNMTKLMDGTFGVDNGSTLSNGILAMKKYGVCHESEFPYLIERFNQMPSDAVKLSAMNHQLVGSYAIEAGDIDSIELAIANGYSVSFGMKIFNQFESDEAAKTGIIETPSWYQTWMNIGCLGGHALRIFGYSRKTHMFDGMNSWGEWGDKGAFHIPYDYIGNSRLAWDFAVITRDELDGEAV